MRLACARSPEIPNLIWAATVRRPLSKSTWDGTLETDTNMTHQEFVKRLEGVFPPLVTPFNRRGDVDEGAFRSNLERYTKIGLAGVVVAGSNGEAPHLTEAERLRLVEIARAIVRPPELVIAGTGLDGTAQTLKLSREAVARGADAALVLPPAYYRSAMQPNILEAHFRVVADGLRRPLLIYSIPQCTGFALEPGMIAKLSRHPNIPGMKESSGKVDFDRAILGKTPPKFRLLLGSALAFLDGLKAGACGGVLSQANFVPQLCIGIFEAFRQNDLKTADQLQARLLTLVEGVTGPYGVAGVKAALDVCGYRGGDPRLPLQPLSLTARRRVAAAVKRACVGLDV
jgi:4-hydroxy-2-oxoglutarate aldolase